MLMIKEILYHRYDMHAFYKILCEEYSDEEIIQVKTLTDLQVHYKLINYCITYPLDNRIRIIGLLLDNTQLDRSDLEELLSRAFIHGHIEIIHLFFSYSILPTMASIRCALNSEFVIEVLRLAICFDQKLTIDELITLRYTSFNKFNYILCNGGIDAIMDPSIENHTYKVFTIFTQHDVKVSELIIQCIIDLNILYEIIDYLIVISNILNCCSSMLNYLYQLHLLMSPYTADQNLQYVH